MVNELNSLSWVRGNIQRDRGGTSYLVEWSDSSDGTEHKCSWEPEQNLTHCPQLIKEWFELGLTEQKDGQTRPNR